MAHNGGINRRSVLKTGGLGITIGLAGCSSLTPSNDGGGDGGTDFPSQDIEIIVPYAAGGGTDRTGRFMAERLQEELGQSSFVTNQTGGSGSVGFNQISTASSDGHTIGILTVEIATLTHLGISDLTPEDVTPVAQYNFDPAALTVHEDAPYGTLGEFVDYANENPGEISVSNSGTGAIWHLAAAEFGQVAGIELEHVGYEGASPATEAVLSGEVQATTSSAPEVIGQVRDGPLEMLAFFGEERYSQLEDVPTLMEEGYDVTTGAWRGIGGPADLNENAQSTLSDAVGNIVDSSEFEEFMSTNGFGIQYRDAEEYGTFMADEYERFGDLIAELGLGE